MGVPFFDSKQHYRLIKDEVDAHVQRVMDSCRFVLGENVKCFEREFARFCGTEYAVGVANGTDAFGKHTSSCRRQDACSTSKPLFEHLFRLGSHVESEADGMG